MKQQHHNLIAYAYDKRGMLLSIGKNSYAQTHPLQAHFARLVGQPDRIYLHAEVDALLKARGRIVYKLVVQRFDKKGSPVCASPCPICQMAIKAFGVRIVEHT